MNKMRVPDKTKQNITAQEKALPEQLLRQGFIFAAYFA